MTARGGRRYCFVCKLPASQKDPLWDAVWRDNKTGEAHLRAVHVGACADALLSTHTPTTLEETMPKLTDEATPEVTDVESEAARNLADIDQAAQPGNVPAVAEPPADGGDDDIADGEVVDQAPANIPAITSEQVMRYIRYGEPLPEFDSADVARAIALELLDAPSLEDAMRPVEMLEAKDITYRNLVVHGVKWQSSDKRENPDAFPVYAVMDVTDVAAKQRALVTCGGLNVVAIMIKADLAGEFPLRLKLAMQSTRSGNETYKVESWADDGEESF